jgi:hypothetical protein
MAKEPDAGHFGLFPVLKDRRMHLLNRYLWSGSLTFSLAGIMTCLRPFLTFRRDRCHGVYGPFFKRSYIFQESNPDSLVIP